MSKLPVRLVSLLLFAALCAVSTYWFIVLTSRSQAVGTTAEPPVEPSTDAAGDLFGGSPAVAARQEYRVVGILSLGAGHGAAAIIASSDGPTHTIAAGQSIDGQTRLKEVRERSVVLERAGVKSELFLPGPTPSSGYLR